MNLAPQIALSFAILCCLLSCDDGIQNVDTPELQVLPERIVFPALDPTINLRTVPVEVTNVGQGVLRIASISLEEDDQTQELSILDADDWQQVRELAPSENSIVTVAWRPLDAQADEGRLVITHSAGGPVSVPITTADTDPVLIVQTDPAGSSSNGEVSVRLTRDAMEGSQQVRVELTSGSVAPLEVSNLCLLQPDGTCAENNVSGAFKICDGLPRSVDNCDAPTVPEALILDASHVFTAVFMPPVDAVNTFAVQVLIESNSARYPRFLVKLTGSTCERRSAGDVCGTCGDGVVDDGEGCDDGNVDDNDACLNSCEIASCGDGIVQSGEACDDGNRDETDGCLNNCEVARCGDGAVQSGLEACDDGNQEDGDACRNNCVAAACGDGVVWVGVEECDDGNQDNTDACRNRCEAAPCGEGEGQTSVADCDDGNPCTADSCIAETGFCQHELVNGEACTPSQSCSPGGVCETGACVPTVAEPCDDVDPCTRDRCDEASGVCFHDFDESLGGEGIDCRPDPCDDTDLFWEISAEEMRTGASDPTGPGICFGRVRFNGGTAGSTGSMNVCSQYHCGTLVYNRGPACDDSTACTGQYAPRTCFEGECKQRQEYCTVRAECINGVPTAVGFSW